MSNQINFFFAKNLIYARIDEKIRGGGGGGGGGGGLALWARLSSWIMFDQNGSLRIDRCVL